MEDECCSYLMAMLGEKIAVEALSASERKRAGWLVNLYALKAVSIRGRRHVLAFAKAAPPLGSDHFLLTLSPPNVATARKDLYEVFP